MLYTGKSILDVANENNFAIPAFNISDWAMFNGVMDISEQKAAPVIIAIHPCLLYTSPSPRDRQKSRMPSSA